MPAPGGPTTPTPPARPYAPPTARSPAAVPGATKSHRSFRSPPRYYWAPQRSRSRPFPGTRLCLPGRRRSPTRTRPPRRRNWRPPSAASTRGHLRRVGRDRGGDSASHGWTATRPEPWNKPRPLTLAPRSRTTCPRGLRVTRAPRPGRAPGSDGLGRRAARPAATGAHRCRSPNRVAGRARPSDSSTTTMAGTTTTAATGVTVAGPNSACRTSRPDRPDQDFYRKTVSGIRQRTERSGPPSRRRSR